MKKLGIVGWFDIDLAIPLERRILGVIPDREFYAF